ncbi:MAG: preprotein translocase subunit SecE [bacterium]
MTSLFSYLTHVRAELSHVTWPSRKEAIEHTLLVLFISLITALLIGALDYVFTTVVSYYVGA